MSKGKDFRAPRKRGFDDDGPMPYEPKTRTPRAFGGATDGGFGAPAMAGMPASAPAAGPTIDAVVKWFKADKGYGFVELANGQGDAFLHANALHASGHDSVPAGAKLKVLVGAGAKGAQVAHQSEEVGVTRDEGIDIDDRQREAGALHQSADARALGERRDPRRDAA